MSAFSPLLSSGVWRCCCFDFPPFQLFSIYQTPNELWVVCLPFSTTTFFQCSPRKAKEKAEKPLLLREQQRERTHTNYRRWPRLKSEWSEVSIRRRRRGSRRSSLKIEVKLFFSSSSCSSRLTSAITGNGQWVSRVPACRTAKAAEKTADCTINHNHTTTTLL